MIPLPLNSLRIFCAAARLRSFRAAAEALGLTPGAVTHAIKKLETVIGASLFERDGHSFYLSPTGTVLYQNASKGFDEIQRAMENVYGRPTNVLRLHSAPSIAAQWLVRRLGLFSEKHPHILIRLAANTAYPKMLNDEFDISISYGAPRQEGHSVIALGEEEVCPLCTQKWAEMIKSPEDIANYPLIDSTNSQVRWDDWCTRNGLQVPVSSAFQFDRSFMSIISATDGLGIALEFRILAEREIRAGQLIAPLNGMSTDVKYVGHHLVIPNAARRKKAVTLFTEWILSEFQKSVEASKTMLTPPSP